MINDMSSDKAVKPYDEIPKLSTVVLILCLKGIENKN